MTTSGPTTPATAARCVVCGRDVPGTSVDWADLGRVYSDKHDYKRAAEAFQRSIDLAAGAPELQKELIEERRLWKEGLLEELAADEEEEEGEEEQEEVEPEDEGGQQPVRSPGGAEKDAAPLWDTCD